MYSALIMCQASGALRIKELTLPKSVRTLQMGKRRHRKVKEFSQGYIASTWQSQGSSPGCQLSSLTLITTDIKDPLPKRINLVMQKEAGSFARGFPVTSTVGCPGTLPAVPADGR